MIAKEAVEAWLQRDLRDLSIYKKMTDKIRVSGKRQQIEQEK